VVKKEQQAGPHKTTGATSRDYKETRNLQHKDQRSRRRPSVENILKILKFKKTIKQRTYIKNFSELTEENYNVA
jgi:hypothetical protein